MGEDNIKALTDIDLKNYNSHQIKAICEKAYFPEIEDGLISFYKNIKSFVLLRSGHNVILYKEYYDDNFHIFNDNYKTMS